jgi:Putative Actinobacterial Holin-X, holin superfamily III
MKGGPMDNMANDNRLASTSDRSTGDLVGLLSEQVSVLVRDELKLARLEMTRKGKQAGLGVGILGSSVLLALYGAGCLLVSAIIAIAGAVAAWMAALIVGAALVAAAAAAALVAKGRLRKARPPIPEETVSSIKTDVAEIKEGARR